MRPNPPSQSVINQRLASTQFDNNELAKYTNALKGEIALKPMGLAAANAKDEDHPVPQHKPPVPGTFDGKGIVMDDTTKGVIGEPDFKRGGLIPKKHYANGGNVDDGPLHQSGLFNSLGSGRTDIHNRQVPAGGYVIPADVVSGLAEGNTAAGADIIRRMMQTTLTQSDVQKGLASGNAKPVPVVVAGGEVFISPQEIIAKFGNLERGHKVLDAFVKKVRAKNIKTLKTLPGPKR